MKSLSEHFGLDKESACSSQVPVSITSSISSDEDPNEINDHESVSNRVLQFLEEHNSENTPLPEEEGSHDGSAEDDSDSFNFKCACLNNCFQHFEETEIQDHVFRLREMEKKNKEMYIMGSIKRVGSKNMTSKRKERKRLRYEYSFQEQGICRQAFLIINDITEKVLKTSTNM